MAISVAFHLLDDILACADCAKLAFAKHEFEDLLQVDAGDILSIGTSAGETGIGRVGLCTLWHRRAVAIVALLLLLLLRIGIAVVALYVINLTYLIIKAIS